ncbi:GNAT family N-acetyltransferase, partial [Candidatus Poribacteria bacterium]
GWSDDVFGSAHFDLRCRPADWRFVVYVDEQVVSQAGIVNHVVIIGNQKVSVGGIGGVLTIPSARLKGHARAMLQAALDFMHREWGAEFGFLICLDRMIPFYQKLGWQKVVDTVIMDQPSGKMPLPSGLSAMVFPCQDEEWPAGTVEMNSMPW